jgi:hypothetical protein
LSKLAPQIKSGIINLADRQGSLFKKALLCRTGSFNGMYGPVEVSKERLERIALKYNQQRSAPKNDNDYAPVLIDHCRSAELCKGRILSDLEVGPWVDPETGIQGSGLYGTLRIDRDHEKVESGQYSQLSISFDEDTDELYEASFVAVEAARGAQLLSKGDTKIMKKTIEQKLAALSESHSALQGRIKDSLAVRSALCLAAVQVASEGETELAAATAQLKKIQGLVRTVTLSAQFKGFIRQGKLTKAEFDKLNISELSTLSESALKAVLAAYDGRAVSTDVAQIGQAGAKPPTKAELSSKDMREAIKLQRQGKTVALQADEKNPNDDKGGEKKPAPGEGDAPSDYSFQDMDEAMKHLESIGPMIEKLGSYMGKLKESVGKLQEQDSKDKEGSESKDLEDSEEEKDQDSKKQGDK